MYDLYISKDEEIHPSLAYKVLSAQNTKKLMTVENVDELAWYVVCSVHVQCTLKQNTAEQEC